MSFLKALFQNIGSLECVIKCGEILNMTDINFKPDVLSLEYVKEHGVLYDEYVFLFRRL